MKPKDETLVWGMFGKVSDMRAGKHLSPHTCLLPQTNKTTK